MTRRRHRNRTVERSIMEHTLMTNPKIPLLGEPKVKDAEQSALVFSSGTPINKAAVKPSKPAGAGGGSSKPSSSTPSSSGTGTTWKGSNDSHFREPLMVDKDHRLYLSSSRDHDVALRKPGARLVDMGVYLDSGWRTKMQPSSAYNAVLVSDGLPKKLHAPATLLETWEGTPPIPIKGVYLPWQDRGAPPIHKVMALVDWINKLLDEGVSIEVACMGGHGRTGTLAACVMLSRNPSVGANDAIKYIRAAYCKEAIESHEQVTRIYEMTGETPPAPPPTPAYQYKGTGTAGKSYGIGNYPLDNIEYRSLKTWLLVGPVTERVAMNWMDRKRKEVEQEVGVVESKAEPATVPSQYDDWNLYYGD